MHANSKISIYSNEIHSSIHISMVISEISLKVKSNGYTFMHKSVSIDLFNLPPLPDKQNKKNHTWTCHTITTYPMGRIPDCWTEQTG